MLCSLNYLFVRLKVPPTTFRSSSVAWNQTSFQYEINEPKIVAGPAKQLADDDDKAKLAPKASFTFFSDGHEQQQKCGFDTLECLLVTVLTIIIFLFRVSFSYLYVSSDIFTVD